MTSFKLRTAIAAAALVILAPSFAFAQNTESLPAHVADFTRTEAIGDHVVGSENAAVTLIMWASVTCPHCAEWFSKEWPVVKSELVETGKLRVVFRPFPTPPENLSVTGFRLAECAPPEDYMSIIEYQMENRESIYDAAKAGRSAEVFSDIAKLAGMETEDAITSCLKNPDITAHIVDSFNRAKLAGIKGVPAFLINGETYTGRQDAKSLIELVSRIYEDGISSLPSDDQAHVEEDSAPEPAQTAE